MTLWTAARQGPLSMGFSRQAYWNGLPLPSPGNLPDPGIELASLMSPALEADSLPLAPLCLGSRLWPERSNFFLSSLDSDIGNIYDSVLNCEPVRSLKDINLRLYWLDFSHQHGCVSCIPSHNDLVSCNVICDRDDIYQRKFLIFLALFSLLHCVEYAV